MHTFLFLLMYMKRFDPRFGATVLIMMKSLKDVITHVDAESNELTLELVIKEYYCCCWQTR